MIDLTTNARKTIVSALSGIGFPVYFGEADETAQLPYVIYDLQTVSMFDGVRMCELEINVVGYGRDTTPVENVCDRIERVFDHKTFNENDVSFTSYFERKSRVDSEDRKIIRRRLVFNINLYERG